MGALPTDTFSSAWHRYREWAETSAALKIAQTRARTVALVFGVAAAALGAFAAGARSFDPEATRPVLPWLTGASALLLATGGYVGRELLIPEHEHRWVRARMYAEKIKRDLWLYLIGAPPYHDADDRKRRLGEGTLGIVDADVQARVLAPDDVLVVRKRKRDPLMCAPCGVTKRARWYLIHRLQQQVQWYRREVATMEARVGWSQWLRFGFGVLAAGAGLTAFARTPLPETIPLLTTCSAALLAHVHAQRSVALVGLYRRTADELVLQWLDWHECPAEERDIELLAVRCEALMERENQSWQTERVREDRLVDARELFEAVLGKDPEGGVAQPRACVDQSPAAIGTMAQWGSSCSDGE
ncbi:MAG: DUF4231 domain-containing protein [Nannocystaceae bacterium]